MNPADLSHASSSKVPQPQISSSFCEKASAITLFVVGLLVAGSCLGFGIPGLIAHSISPLSIVLMGVAVLGVALSVMALHKMCMLRQESKKGSPQEKTGANSVAEPAVHCHPEKNSHEHDRIDGIKAKINGGSGVSKEETARISRAKPYVGEVVRIPSRFDWAARRESQEILLKSGSSAQPSEEEGTLWKLPSPRTEDEARERASKMAAEVERHHQETVIVIAQNRIDRPLKSALRKSPVRTGDKL